MGPQLVSIRASVVMGPGSRFAWPGRRKLKSCPALHFAPPGIRWSQSKMPEETMSSLASKEGPRYRHTADSTEPYETIGVEKLTPIIGAEISGVDLASALSNRTMDEIHRALAENLVIF